MASSKKKATPKKEAAKKKAAPSSKDTKPKVGPNPVTSQSRLSDKNRNNPRDISAADALAAKRKEERAARRNAGVRADGSRSGTGAAPKPAKKAAAKSKSSKKRYYGPTLTYDNPYGDGDIDEGLVRSTEALESRRLRQDYDTSEDDTTESRVMRPSGVNPALAGEERLPENLIDYYGGEGSGDYEGQGESNLGAGELPDVYDLYDQGIYDQNDEFRVRAEGGTLPEELRSAGVVFDAPEEYLDTLSYSTEGTLKSGMSGISDQSEVIDGVRYRRDRPLGARPEGEVRAEQADSRARRNQNLIDSLTRTASPAGTIPASLPVTREEVLASQQWLGIIEPGSTSVHTDEPPVEKGVYRDTSDPDKPFKEGLVTKVNRGYIVPPSQQDTRRRRLRTEAVDVAKGAQALGEAMEGAAPLTRRSTTIKRSPQRMATGELVGTEEDVAERTGTTFADIEGDLTAEQRADIGRLGTTPGGKPTASARAGLFSYLRNRAPRPEVSDQLKEFSAKIMAGVGGEEGQPERYFDHEKGEWSLVEPPLDDKYQYEWAGGYGLEELGDTPTHEALRRELESLASRRYTPYSQPKTAPNRSATGRSARVQRPALQQSGLPLSTSELVSTEVDGSTAVEPTETQVKTESGRYKAGAGKAVPLLEQLLEADKAKGVDPGTTADLIAKQFDIPNLHEMTMDQLLDSVKSPRGAVITPSQQRSRQAADRPDTPEARAARDTARSETGGERRSVRRLKFARRAAAAVAAEQGIPELRQAGDLNAELTGAQADEIMGGQRVINRELSREYVEDFSGKGGGERNRAGTIRPGSEATITRAILRPTRKTWSTSGEVPISDGRPAVTDTERGIMATTHPVLASALDQAMGMGRVVLTDATGKVLGANEAPALTDESGEVVRDAAGKVVKKEMPPFAYGPRVQAPGTVPSVPVKVPGGEVDASTRIEPMPIHISKQFGYADEPGRVLPMVAGPNSGLIKSDIGNVVGVREGRVIPADVDVSNAAALATVPAVRRAAAYPRRMAGIKLAKERLAEMNPPSQPTPEQIREDKRAAGRGVREAKLQSARRARFTSKPEIEQRQTRESLYIQEPSVELGVSSPDIVSRIKDYADFTENTYVSSPSKPLNVPSITGVINKPGTPKTTEMVSRVHGFETSSGTPSRDVAGLPRQDVMRKIGTTSAFRAMKNAENATGYGGIVTPAISREFSSGNLSMSDVYDPTNRGFGNPRREIPGRINKKGDLDQTPTFDERISSIYGAGERGSTVLQGGQWANAQPTASPMTPPSLETGYSAPSTNFGVANPRTTAVGMARNPIGTRPTPKSPGKKARKPKS